MPRPTTVAAPVPASDADLVAELRAQLRERDARIDRLIDALERLAAGAIASHPVAVPAPVAAPTVQTGPTFADIWTWYLETLPAAWKDKAVSTMRWVLAWFAPSVCFRRWTDGGPDPACLLRVPGRRPRVATAGPDMLVDELRPHHWLAFRLDLQARHPEIGVTSRNLMHGRVLAMLNRAVEQQRIEQHRMGGAKREAKKPKRRTRLTDDYLERLRPHASALVWAYAVTICDSGARPGEVRLLRWTQVDAARESFELTLPASQVKGKKRARAIFLTPRCFEAYDALPRLPDNVHVFGSPKDTGQPYSKLHLWRLFRDAVDAAGLEAADGDGTVHAHDGRRAYASKLISADVALPKVQELLGHADIGTTRGYIDVDHADLREAHSRLATAARLPPKRSE